MAAHRFRRRQLAAIAAGHPPLLFAGHGLSFHW
jgi:hypothetical protein